MIEKYVKSAIRKLYPKKQFETHDGSIIPAKHLRFNGAAFKDNDYYIKTAEAEAQRAKSKLGCKTGSRVFEIGCGKGRFVTGLIRVFGQVNYTGFDVHRPSVI